MKFKTEVKKLKRILPFLARVSSSSVTMPILSNIHLKVKENKFILSATNLEIGIEVKLNVENIEKEGEIAIPGKIFSDFISLLPEKEVYLEEKEKSLTLKCEGFETKILGQDPKEFPPLPSIEGIKKATLDASELTKGISKVAHIVSPKDSRIEISGIYFEVLKNEVKLVGTDSIRLAQAICSAYDTNLDKPKSGIVPLSAFVNANHIFGGIEGDVEIFLSPNQISFKSISPELEITLLSRLIEGKFPEYEEVIPRELNFKAILNREEFIQKIKAVSLFSSKIQDIKISPKPDEGKIILFSESTEKGAAQSEVYGKIEGKEIVAVFNFKFLLDGLSPIKSEEIVFGLTSANSPALIKPLDKEDYLYILMPKSL